MFYWSRPTVLTLRQSFNGDRTAAKISAASRLKQRTPAATSKPTEWRIKKDCGLQQDCEIKRGEVVSKWTGLASELMTTGRQVWRLPWRIHWVIRPWSHPICQMDLRPPPPPTSTGKELCMGWWPLIIVYIRIYIALLNLLSSFQETNISFRLFRFVY